MSLEESWEKVYKRVYTINDKDFFINKDEDQKKEKTKINRPERISMDSIAKKTENVPIEDINYIRNIIARIKNKFLDMIR